MARRLNVLHYLLNLKKSDLLYKFFEAQTKNPAKGDWIIQVLKDLTDLEITNNLNDIKIMKKNSFKLKVKEKIKVLALNYLCNIKKEHSKMDNIKYDKIVLQPYLNSSKVNPDLAKHIFKWRTRMADFKNNFKNGNPENACPFGCNQDDSQEMFLKCPVIISNVSELKTSKVVYSDIFSRNVSKIKSAGELLRKAFKVRTNLIYISKEKTLS